MPVSAAPGPEPEPVETSAEQIAMGSVEDPAAAADVEDGTTEPVGGVPPTAPVLTVTETRTEDFSLVGVTWAADPAVTDTVVQVRVQDEAGAWGGLDAAAVEDAGAGRRRPTPTDARGGTAPLWTGPSTGVEAELVTRSGARRPTSGWTWWTRGTAPPTPPWTPRTSPTPPMRPRACRRSTAAPSGAPTSASGPGRRSTRARSGRDHPPHRGHNDYTSADVPAMLRSIYRYHAVSRGWGDIGYNVLADKFGRLWEGRFGGMASTVVGAHAGGFNSTTFGVSMLGTTTWSARRSR